METDQNDEQLNDQLNLSSDLFPDPADLISPSSQSASQLASHGVTTEATSPIRYVTQSSFFTPAFNAAIFDGPIRIYFAQYQEAQALKLYHNLQERFGDVRKHARGIFKERGRNIFVMLYPTEEVFDLCFGQEDQSGTESLGRGAGAEAGPINLSFHQLRPMILQSRLGLDYVLGVCGPMEDSTLNAVCLKMESIVHPHADAETGSSI